MTLPHSSEPNFHGPFQRLSALLAACAILAAGRASADYIVLKNGKRISGLVRAETQLLVRFETAEGVVLVLDREKIARLEIQPSAENLMLSGSLALRKPDFLEAARLLKQSLEAGADAAAMRKAIIGISPRFLDRMAYMSHIEKNMWLGFCDTLSAAAPNDGEWKYLRGEMALAMGDKKAALDNWGSLDADYYTTHPAQRSEVIRWSLGELRKANDERRFDRSIALVELLNKLDAERGRSNRIVVELAMAVDARNRGNLSEACRIYAEEVMPLSPEVAKVCLRQTLKPQCEFLWERGKFPAALQLLRRYALPYLPKVAGQLTKETYQRYIQQTMADGRWEKARGLLAEASEFLDPDEIKKLKDECQYGERRDHLAEDDYVGYYKLGIELEKKQMNGAALEAFGRAAQSPQAELQKMARERIALVREAEAFELLKRIATKVDDSRYIEALDLADQFKKNYPGSKYRGQVESLSQTAHTRLKNDQEKAKNLAKIRVDQAKRLYYLGQIDKALDLVDGVLRDFPHTQGAETARKMKQSILKRRVAESVAGSRDKSSKPVVGAKSILPGIDPQLLDQLDEDAFKKEIQAILDHLEL